MTWEETIKYIRTRPDFKDLVEKAYFEEDLQLNVERFRKSFEFSETLGLVKYYKNEAETILDIGCGNGISSISFALENFKVTCIEPDPSDTIGAGAIQKLIQQYGLQNITLFESYAENLNLQDNSFDVVYIRQAMHHANDLNKFIKECGRVLKKGGLLITIRDHIIFDEADKLLFLESHPLQKFYGGENAFTFEEYSKAIQNAGLSIKKVIKTFDSEINYFPMKHSLVQKAIRKKKLGSFLLNFFPISSLKKKVDNILNERNYAGRMYSFIAIKE